MSARLSIMASTTSGIDLARETFGAAIKMRASRMSPGRENRRPCWKTSWCAVAWTAVQLFGQALTSKASKWIANRVASAPWMDRRPPTSAVCGFTPA